MYDIDLPGRIGALIRHGTIASVDLAAGTVTVGLGEIESQPVRWYTGGAGGTRVWTRPKVGEQVTLFAPEGDIKGAVAMRGFPCDDFPPLADEARELVRFEDGATIAYDPATHKLEAVLPGGATVSIVAPGGVTLDADVRISGDLQVDGKIAAGGDITADNISLVHHKHGLVKAGTDKSGAPL